MSDDDGVKYAERPDGLRQLRACKSCKLVKTLAQFSEHFCDNCWKYWADGSPPSSLSRARRNDTAMENTTTDFEGYVAMMRPDYSWVARWLKMHKIEEDGTRTLLKPGVYAMILPGEELLAAQEQGENGEPNEYEDDEEEDDEDNNNDDDDEAQLEDDEATKPTPSSTTRLSSSSKNNTSLLDAEQLAQEDALAQGVVDRDEDDDDI